MHAAFTHVQASNQPKKKIITYTQKERKKDWRINGDEIGIVCVCAYVTEGNATDVFLEGSTNEIFFLGRRRRK